MVKSNIRVFTHGQRLGTGKSVPHYAGETIHYIGAHFDLDESWEGYDSVRAVWWNGAVEKATVFDATMTCTIPLEVVAKKGDVMVNLIASVSENGVLTDRFTSYPLKVAVIDAHARLTGSETVPVTPSQFEQFVEAVKNYADRAYSEADRAMDEADRAEQAAEGAEASATAAEASATDAEAAKTAALTAKGAAETAEGNAETAATQAAESATTASGAASTASQKAGEASTYASNAGASASQAQTYASNAEQSATAASGSASAAETAAASAEQSATDAGNYVGLAEASATSAEASATSAEASATSAKASATSAKASATSAAASATQAQESATQAAQSAMDAAASETATEAAATRAEQAAASLVVDDALSETSENPVQNKVITGEVTQLRSATVEIQGEIADLKSALDVFNGGTINLLNHADFQQGKYLVVGGGLANNANLTASGFFPVDGNTTYYFYRSDTYRVRVCFYTAVSEAGYIYDSLTDISPGTSTFTTPATASYARISTNKNMILDMGIYASDIRYYIPYKLRLNADVSIENQIDNTLADAKKAAPADAVGQIKSHVIFPENCIKYGDAGMIINERLDLDTGAIITNSSGQTRTDYIPVNVGDYVQTCAIRDICLYDDQFAYIGFISLWSVNDTPAPPASWSGNYNSNITQITAINGINPSYIRCWGRYDKYPPAVTMLSGEPYKVLNLGDSIFGNNEKPWDLGTYIQNITGLKDANCGYGGTTARVIPSGNMSPLGLPSIVDCIVEEDFSPLKTPEYWASLQEYRYGVPTLLFGMLDLSKIEVITIAYGTNDWNSDTPLDNADNRLDTSTYKGGLRYAVENLQTKYPAITLVMLSPIFRYWSNASDYSTVDQDSDTRTNSLGLKLTDYVTAMQEVAAEYHLPFYNNYDNIGLNRYTAPTWLRDGTHLNRGIGVDKMGHIVAREVNQIY